MTPTREEVERWATWLIEHHKDEPSAAMLRALLAERNQWIANSRENKLIAESNLRERDAALAEAARLREALLRIERWEMPRTGRYHPNGDEQSYSWCYGSNGEREVIRSIARAALATEARDE